MRPSRIALLFLAALGSRDVGAQLTFASSPSVSVTTAVAGSQPTDAVFSTTYTVVETAGPGTSKITCRLMVALPAGTTVTVSMAAPPGATSMGAVTLTTTAQDLVINIPRPTNATRAVTYTFSANVTAGVLASASQVIRFRLQ